MKPNNNMDCHVAPALRNDAKLVVLFTNPNIYPRNDTKLVVSPDNLNTFTPAVILNPTTIQG